MILFTQEFLVQQGGNPMPIYHVVPLVPHLAFPILYATDNILSLCRYFAPEYAEHGIVSVRTDVYAFGIVLFQLISGRRVLDEQNGQRQHLLEWVWQNFIV